MTGGRLLPGDRAPLGSVGGSCAGVEVRLVDLEGADVLVGDVGEMLVRGPNVFKGYWNDPEATERVLDADGWLTPAIWRWWTTTAFSTWSIASRT
ncbi:MAG: AMP-binding protein [Microthrixaceae bacterium]|nr:AMP-binding protein [Microthrixaceae bacterium]